MQDLLHTRRKRSCLPLRICSVVAAGCAVLSGFIAAANLFTIDTKPERVIATTSFCEVFGLPVSLLTVNERK